jgi:autotransporter-associated beta strand protein
MNKVFGLKWSADKGMTVPVPEVLVKRRSAKRRLAPVIAGAVLLAGGPALAAYTEVDISGYLNGNPVINPQYFPVGSSTGNVGQGIPFITSAYGGSNYMGSAFLQGTTSPGTSSTLTINLAGQSLTGQKSFYALLNNYYGTPSANEYNITLNFTNSTSYTYQSIGGVDTRDFNYNPATAQTIANTTANWWTDLIQTTPTTWQRLDVRTFSIPLADQGLTIGSLTITQLQSGDPAMLSGLTFSTLPPVSLNTSALPLTNIVTTGSLYLSSDLGTSVNSVFQGGTLQISATGSITNDFTVDDSVSGATSAIDQNGNNATFTGVLSDAPGQSGSMSIVNSGTGGSVTFTGVNTYTGGTTIGAAATLALSGGGSIASSSGVTDNGTFDISAANGGVPITSLSGSVTGVVNLGANTLTLTNASGSFAGTIGGTGGLTIAGGTETLTGSNTYSGATEIANAATLNLSGSLSGTTVTIDAGGTLNDSAGGLAHGTNLTVNGTANVSANQTIATLNGGGVVGVASGDTLSISNGGTFGGVVSGAGGLAITGGTETLIGTNTYTGSTTITSGTLQIGNGGTVGSVASSSIVDNGTLVFAHSDNVMVPAGVTISGTGALTQSGTGVLTLNGNNSVSGAVTVASGTLAVGDAATPGARLNASIGGVTVASGATLEGHGTIVGAVSNLASGTVRPGGSIGTLTVGGYAQGASGIFAVEVNPATASALISQGPASLAGTTAVTFDAGAYGAKVYPILFGSPVTGRFSTLTQTNAPKDAVYGLYYQPNGREVDLVVTPTRTAAIYGDITTLAVEGGQSFGDMLLRHLEGDGCTASGQLTENGAAMTGGTPDGTCQRGRVWLQPFGTMGSFGGDQNGAFSQRGAGVAAGIDMTLSNDAVVGLGMRYTNDRISMNGSDSSASMSGYQIGLYAMAPVGAWRVSGTGFYFGTSSTVSRDTLGGSQANTSPHGQGMGAAMQIAYEMAGGDISPAFSLHYVTYNQGAVTESNAGALGFHIDARTMESLRGDLGVRLQHSFVANGNMLTPTLWLGIEQAFNTPSGTVSGALAGVPSGTAFSVSSPVPDRTMAVADLRLLARVNTSLQLYVDVGGRFGADGQQGQAILGGQLRF